MKETALKDQRLHFEEGETFTYDETVKILQTLFGWKPSLPTRILARLLMRIVHPLEQGSYHGRVLPGEPHRASWVISGPLTVFILDEARYWRRVFLLSRLRVSSHINLIDIGKETKDERRFSGFLSWPPKKAERAAKSYFRDKSPFVSLVELQKKTLFNITVIPVAHTSTHLPKEAPPLSRAAKIEPFTPMNIFRKITSLWRTLRTGSLKNTQPIALKLWIGNFEELNGRNLSQELRLDVVKRMAAERRAAEGILREPLWQVKRKVLADPVLSSFMQEYSISEGVEIEEVMKEAEDYIKEIASDVRVGVVRWFARAVDFAFDKFLERIDVDRWGIKFLRECDLSERIVLVCSHKSYIDPLLIGYTMFRCGLATPQQAAGLNLNFWPVGWLLRHSGAFYLRRTFSGENLYREVFSSYVRYLLAANCVSVVYIEGTRSRDGKLARPKLGYMGILEKALQMGVCKDIKLVPVYMGYDKVAEESSHVREMAGSRKVSESVKGFANIYRSVNTTLGRAFVKFAEPMSMKELLSNRGLQGAAIEATRAINSVTPVTARSVVAASLLCSGETWVRKDDVFKNCRILMDFARSIGAPLVDGTGEVEPSLKWFESEGRIESKVYGEEEGFSVEGQARRYLEYNKNIPISHFVEYAMIALSVVSRDDFEPSLCRENYIFLRNLFSEEFVYPWGDSWQEKFDDAFEIVKGNNLLAQILASLIHPFLEGYFVAINIASRLEDGQALERDMFIKLCFESGGVFKDKGKIKREESLSKVVFKTAEKKLSRDGFIKEVLSGESGKEEMLLIRGEKFGEIANILRRIESFL